jgi:hypothetical protein
MEQKAKTEMPSIIALNDHSGISTTIPVINSKINTYIERIKHHNTVTMNLDNNIILRDMGNANKSFIVLSEYSLPKIQLVINPNTISPPTHPEMVNVYIKRYGIFDSHVIQFPDKNISTSVSEVDIYKLQFIISYISWVR